VLAATLILSGLGVVLLSSRAVWCNYFCGLCAALTIIRLRKSQNKCFPHTRMCLLVWCSPGISISLSFLFFHVAGQPLMYHKSGYAVCSYFRVLCAALTIIRLRNSPYNCSLYTQMMCSLVWCGLDIFPSLFLLSSLSFYVHGRLFELVSNESRISVAIAVVFCVLAKNIVRLRISLFYFLCGCFSSFCCYLFNSGSAAVGLVLVVRLAVIRVLCAALKNIVQLLNSRISGFQMIGILTECSLV